MQPFDNLEIQSGANGDKNELCSPPESSDTKILKKDSNLASPRTAFFSLCKGGIGTGILFAPYIFSQCGDFWSVLLLILPALLSYLSYALLLDVLDALSTEQTDLSDACKVVLGVRYQSAARLAINAFNVGINIAYLVVILHALQLLLPRLSQYLLLKLIATGTCVAICMPFIMRAHISQIKYFALFGLIICIAIIFLMIVNAIYLLCAQTQQPPAVAPFRLQAIPLNFGIVLFLYDINGIVTSIRKQTQSPENNYRNVLRYYFLFQFTLAVLLGILHKHAYGRDTSVLVFDNLATNGIVAGTATNFISTTYALTLLVNIVVNTLPVAEDMDMTLKYRNIPLQLKSKIAVRATLLIFMALCAVCIPSIVSVVNIVGCIFSVVLGFVFPFLLYEKHFNLHQKRASSLYFTKYVVLISAIIGGLIGLGATIAEEI